MKLPKLIFVDILIVLIGAAGVVFFTYMFVQDINATLIRLEEEPVGYITDRYNIAQRRFNNRLVWDRLQNNSPVYNGDIIRTDNLSEVTISFDYGESVSLYSNTLIQIFADSGGNRIDFTSGELIINTPEPGEMRQISRNTSARRRRRTADDSERTDSERSANNERRNRHSENSEDSERTDSRLIINTGDQRLRVGRNSAIRLSTLDDGDLELSVSKGTVVLEETPPEPTQRRRRNQENPEDTERTRRTERSENPESTERTRSSVVINTGEQRIRTERGSSIRLDSQAGELEVSVNEGAMVLESAVTDETLSVETGRRIRLNSRRNTDETTELSEIVVESTEQPRRERQPRDNNTPPRDRTIGSQQREMLSAPRNRIPEDQHTITPQMIINSQSLSFSWDSVNDANGYILTISRENEGFRSQLLQTPVLTETTYTIENIRRYRGNLFWSVEAVRVSNEGTIEQRGRIRENSLIIDIPRQERSTQENSSERRNRSR